MPVDDIYTEYDFTADSVIISVFDFKGALQYFHSEKIIKINVAGEDRLVHLQDAAGKKRLLALIGISDGIGNLYAFEKRDEDSQKVTEFFNGRLDSIRTVQISPFIFSKPFLDKTRKRRDIEEMPPKEREMLERKLESESARIRKLTDMGDANTELYMRTVVRRIIHEMGYNSWRSGSSIIKIITDY